MDPNGEFRRKKMTISFRFFIQANIFSWYQKNTQRKAAPGTFGIFDSAVQRSFR